MLKKRTKQLIAISGLAAVVGTTVPVGVVVGLQQKSAAQRINTPDNGKADPGKPAADSSAPAAAEPAQAAPAAALAKPDDQVSETITSVDNTSDLYASDDAFPTEYILPPTPLAGYQVSEAYQWKTANGAVMSHAAFRSLQDKESFSAVWTVAPTGATIGLPYTYTQRFVVAWPAVVVPENQQSTAVTKADNTSRSSLPTDLLVPPQPANGYVPDGTVKWTDAQGSPINDDGFVRLTDKARFFAVWTFKRADGRAGSYAYSQIFEIAQPQVIVPVDTQSLTVFSVDNLQSAKLPADLLVSPAPHPDYEPSGTVVWRTADGTPLTEAAYATLADKSQFAAVWTFVRKDKKPGSYTHTQRFAIAQNPVVVPADQTSPDVTAVDNTVNNTLPAELIKAPTPAAGYGIKGTYALLDDKGAPLTPAAFKALKVGAEFQAVWTLERTAGGNYSYKYAQRFKIALAVYANESSATTSEVDVNAFSSLPNDLRVSPVAKPGYAVFGVPVWQLPNGALLNFRSFSLLPDGTEFGAVWTLVRQDGQPGSYVYTQRFVAKNANLSGAKDQNVYPVRYPVLTDRQTLVYGFRQLPNIAPPAKLANYDAWTAPTFTEEATGALVDVTKLAELPAGTVLVAKMTADPAAGYTGRQAEYVLKYVVQKAQATVDNAKLSTYGYGYILNNDPTAALTGQLDRLKPARIDGYTDWNPRPRMQVKVNFGPLKETLAWTTIADGTSKTMSLADFIASARQHAATSPTVQSGWSQVDPLNEGQVYDIEYRYVWTAVIDQNHSGKNAVEFTQNFYLTNRLLTEAIDDSPSYEFGNTGYSRQNNQQLAINGSLAQISFANMAEGVIYRYPATVDNTAIASPVQLPIKLPDSFAAASGKSVPTISGDLYSYDKKANNGYFFYKWQAGNMILKDASYAADMPDLSTVVGRHVAFSSTPLVDFAYSSDSTADLVAVANRIKLASAYYYAGFYYIPEDYEAEQMDMNGIQKSLWDWKPSYNDPTGHVANDYKINLRYGNLKLPPLAGYDASGKPIYERDGYAETPPVSNLRFLGSDAGSISAEQLQAGYFANIYSSPVLYTSEADKKATTHFNIGTYTYIKGDKLRSVVFAYFENLPISNVRPDVGFAYMINGMTVGIDG